jgi:hypothetical protein
LIINCGLFTLQELPSYLRQLIMRVVLQLLCVFCQFTCNDPVEFDIRGGMFIGEGNRSTCGKPQTYRKSLTNFIT